MKCKFCKFIKWGDSLNWRTSNGLFQGDGLCVCENNNFLAVCNSEGILGELIIRYDFWCINFEYNKFWKQRRFNEICENFQRKIKWKQNRRRDKINQNNEGLNIIKDLLKKNKLPKIRWGNLYNGASITEVTGLLTENEKIKYRELQVKLRLEGK